MFEDIDMPVFVLTNESSINFIITHVSKRSEAFKCTSSKHLMISNWKLMLSGMSSREIELLTI